MKNIFKVVLFLFLLSGSFVIGQTVEFTGTAPGVVSVGEQFRLVYSINAECSGFKLPDVKGFEVLAGPFTSSSSSFQIINGRTSQSVSNSFTYVLEATKEGKFAIPPATALVNGTKQQSNSISIEVMKGSAQANNNNATRESNPVNTDYAGDLFVRVNVDKTSVYQGECLAATIKIYTRMRLLDFVSMKFPSYTGFWSQDIQTPNQIQLQRENINGRPFDVGLLKQAILFPQKSGDLIIDPFELECVVQMKTGQSRGIFGGVFDEYDNVNKKLRSLPVKINVKPLPGAQPDGFSGAVGTDFKMTATIDKQNIKTNEGVTLKVSLSGNGNIKLIEPLKIDIPATFEKYDPKIEDNIRNTPMGQLGSKNVEYFFIARSAGDYRIAPLKFSYFDINARQYRTLTSNEFNIHVEKGTDNEVAVTGSRTLKAEVESLGNDIRFINLKDFDLFEKGSTFFGSFLFYLLFIIPLLAFGVIIILRRKYIKESANIILMKNKKANKVSRLRLKLASKFLSENNKDAFYEEVHKAVSGYLSDKLGIPVSQLTRENIVASLQNAKIDDELNNKVINILDTCEYARYAPVSEGGEMKNIYAEASDIITKLENKLR